MRLLVYSIQNKNIVANIPIGSNYENYFDEPLDSIEYENPPVDWMDYKVIDTGKIAKMTNLEINELKSYGRILTEEERFEKEMLDKLQPSSDEIKKAENTIEILELLSEVL